MNAYTETQSFLKRWWLILLPVVLIMVFNITVRASKPDADPEAWIPPLTVIIIVCGFVLTRTLTTRIDEESVRVSFPPFVRSNTRYEWRDIASATVRRYRPFMEYGGWGYRRAWSKRGRAYNVWGRDGLQLELKDGSHILIGTQNAARMRQYLQYLKDKYQIEAILPA